MLTENVRFYISWASQRSPSLQPFISIFVNLCQPEEQPTVKPQLTQQCQPIFKQTCDRWSEFESSQCPPGNSHVLLHHRGSHGALKYLSWAQKGTTCSHSINSHPYCHHRGHTPSSTGLLQTSAPCLCCGVQSASLYQLPCSFQNKHPLPNVWSLEKGKRNYFN